jgi:hypothetical protein
LLPGRTEIEEVGPFFLGCFFAHLSYSLSTVRLASSFFMLAHASTIMLGLLCFGWAKPLFTWDM